MNAAETSPAVDSVLVFVGGDLIGDGLMKLPFVRALRHAFPRARITWCAGKHGSVYARALAPLVTGLIDEVIERAGFDRPLRFLLRRPLGGRRFDLVIDTQNGVATALVLRRVRHGRFVSAAAGFLLSDARPARGQRRPASLVGRLLDLVALASGAPAVADAPLSLPAAARAAAAAALPDGPAYVGLAPGAGGRHKCWPLDRFVALAGGQAARGRVPVFILGPAEGEWAARLAAEVPAALIPASDPASGRPGSSDPAFTIALAERLAVAVANDAGVGHLMALADVPLVSLFGPTRPAKFAPAARRLAVIDACDYGAAEMAAIPLGAVADAVERLAGGQRGGAGT
jgi:ADP-heptose:LPS heptosyltransferase